MVPMCWPKSVKVGHQNWDPSKVPMTVGKEALSERSLAVASKKLGPEAKEQSEEVRLAH
jgi:hypothetical protein